VETALLRLYAMRGEILDDSEDSLLLMPGKFADFFKNTADFSRETTLPLSAILMSAQVIHRSIQQ
jgi:hypothetical protein